MIVSGVQRLRERSDTLLARLRLIDRHDRDFRRRRRGWTFAAIGVFALGFVATLVVNATEIASPELVFYLLVIPAVLACAMMAWRYHRLDLDDRKIALVLRLVTMLGADIPARQLIDVALDLRAYRRGAAVVSQSGSRFGTNIKKYRHAWLTLRTRLADGNVLVVAVVDRITRHQKRKTAGSKTKYKFRVRARSDVRIAVRLAKAYRPAGDVAGRLRTVAEVPGLTRASVTPSIDGAGLHAVFRSATVLDTSALPDAAPVLGVLRWLYAGLSPGVRRQA